MSEVWGHGLTEASFARSEHRPGETALQGVRKLLLGDGVDPDAVDARLREWCGVFAARYVALLEATETPHWEVAPHAVETLATLERTHELALLTGNPEPVARARMARLGLSRFFPPGGGGFGCDAEERRDLVAIARARAGGVPAAEVVLVGDTPLDVAGAREAGVPAVAIATGAYDRDELAGADAVLATLAELPAALT